jgi:sterol desaturase/sphingolipid hydroxylase (fatty acid hydroxylase superfamily)
LKKQHWFFALSFAVALLTIAIGLGLLFYRRLGGASNREVARQWSRHAVELPSLNRQHTWWTAGKVVAGLLGVLAYAGGAALVGWGVGLSGAAAVVTLAFGWTLAAAGLAALTWMYAFAFVRLVTRSDVRREAKAWREAAGSPPEPTPLDAVRALRQRQRRGR